MSLSCKKKSKRGNKSERGKKIKVLPIPVGGHKNQSTYWLYPRKWTEIGQPNLLALTDIPMVPNGRIGHDVAHDLLPSGWLLELASTLHFSDEGELERSFSTIKQMYLEVLFFPPPPILFHFLSCLRNLFHGRVPKVYMI